MKVCSNCGYVSSSWPYSRDVLDIIDGRLYKESFMFCPECGSTEIVEAAQCDHCKGWFDEEQLIPILGKYSNGIESELLVCPDDYDDYYFKEPEETHDI